jgi:hypothetical protein
MCRALTAASRPTDAPVQRTLPSYGNGPARHRNVFGQPSRTPGQINRYGDARPNGPLFSRFSHEALNRERETVDDLEDGVLLNVLLSGAEAILTGLDVLAGMCVALALARFSAPQATALLDESPGSPDSTPTRR